MPRDERVDNEYLDNDVSNVFFCDNRNLKRSANIEEGYIELASDPAASSTLVQMTQGQFCKRKNTGQNVLLLDQIPSLQDKEKRHHSLYHIKVILIGLDY